jgi:hypothetical protein
MLLGSWINNYSSGIKIFKLFGAGGGFQVQDFWFKICPSVVGLGTFLRALLLFAPLSSFGFGFSRAAYADAILHNQNGG